MLTKGHLSLATVHQGMTHEMIEAPKGELHLSSLSVLIGPSECSFSKSPLKSRKLGSLVQMLLLSIRHLTLS